jgi:hypothetical protein
MTYSQNVAGLYNLLNETTGTPLANYNDTTKGIQQLIADAKQNNTPLRAIGGNWSFSPITATNGIIINTKGLNSVFPITAASTHPSFTGDKNKLILAQCGNGIWELSNFLHERNMSLPASGASNGQTIAGAIATGTHGAGISFGAHQEAVVGLHIITSPTSSIWLERASVPVMADDFATKLNATLVRDDEAFYAAVVSFGAFGFIHGVMIQAEADYLLECYLRRVPYDDAYKQAFSTLDFNYSHLPYPGEIPFHFQTLINPYDLDNGAYMTVMYKRPYAAHTPPAPNGEGIGPGDDAPTFIGKIADYAPSTLPLIANKVLAANLTPYEAKLGTLAEIFCNTTLSGKVTSTALGFEPKHIITVIETLLQLNKTSGPFAGVFAFRFVKASKATMAFTRFAPVTCVLELDGVQCAATQNFYEAVWAKLKQMNIPYTFHWGKMNNMDAGMVRNMYGSALDNFQAARAHIVDAATLKVFSNNALQQYGIDAINMPAPMQLLV